LPLAATTDELIIQSGGDAAMKSLQTRAFGLTVGIFAVLSGQMASAAPPSPSSWDLETTFSPGAPSSSTAPWESRHANGANCNNDLGLLTMPWSRSSGQLNGNNAATLDGATRNPVIFKNTSTAAASGWAGLTIQTKQVGLTTSATRCAVIRFVAPADGVYKVSGEFFSPQSVSGIATNKATAHVLNGAQHFSGPVDEVGGHHSWTIPAAPTYALHQGEAIDFALNDSNNDISDDVALLSARVVWIDVLPPPPNTFKASNFDFEGNQGCAIEQGTNKTYCWGANAASQLGGYVGASSNKAALAQRVEGYLAANGGGNITNIQVGLNNVCARSSSGRTICWGANTVMQSGVASSPTTMGQNAPYGVADITSQLGNYQKARLDNTTGCIIQSGSMRCWGGNGINNTANGGQLGWKNGSVFTHSATLLAPVPNVSGATDVAPGNLMSCAVVGSAKKVICWSKNPWGPSILGSSGPLLPNPDGIWQTYVKLPNGSDLTDVKRVASNGFHTCALTNGGTIYCWGLANYGAAGAPVMGNNIPIGPWYFSIARTLNFPAGITDFALNYNSTCVVAGAGAQVFCQGVNSSGQLGDPDMAPNKMFTFNPAWPGTYGSTTVVGNLVGNAPKPIAGMSQIVKIRSGSMGNTYCALKSDGSIWCWGKGDKGQLGNGTNTAASPTPVQVIK
jgi:alpha-tubulin suppressor-like RCC1 family protein